MPFADWLRLPAFYLTNRFHVAVRLFNNLSQLTSKVADETIVECVTDVLTTFDVFCDLLLNRRTPTRNLFVLYNRGLQISTRSSTSTTFCILFCRLHIFTLYTRLVLWATLHRDPTWKAKIGKRHLFKICTRTQPCTRPWKFFCKQAGL